jgi:spermidine synthase
MPFFFVFFLVSGFCAILYELVWLRLAMAQFSVATAFVSIVLSVFMLGLGFGSWRAGRFAPGAGARSGARGLRLYALAEALIGLSAMLVPRELAWGRQILERVASAIPLSDGAYYAVAGVLITLALAPWCASMGATFPLAMSAIRERFPDESPRSFSYLYLANISGAVLGSFVPLLFIEEWGFLGALRAGMILNACLAASAFALSFRAVPQKASAAPENLSIAAPIDARPYLWLLFASGLTTMGVEVVWVRLFTAFLGTVVYAFAAILGTYLAATYIGSRVYRARKVAMASWFGGHLALLGVSMLLLLVACDPRLQLLPFLRVVIGVMPFSAGAGFLMPFWLDRISRGDPGRAGRGYAINVVGCVVGPLLSGFVLLPLLGERFSLLFFALPWILAGLVRRPSGRLAPAWQFCAAVAAVLACVAPTRGYEREYSPRKILRDYTATVVAAGRGFERQLLVNGVGMTSLTPITKMMAHLPLAFLPRPPRDAIVICFGMGTTHRSMLSWGIHSTAVELAPSVPRMFSFFHSDADRLLASPLSRVVIDDGRFFLDRTSAQYDAIVIDPPPPVEAAASSLLYSKEFYAAAKPRLRPGGILAQWLPGADEAVQASVAKALKDSFPYVRVFVSFDRYGWHFLASESPIPDRTPEELAARLPAHAAADIVEWGPEDTPTGQFAAVLGQEIRLDDLIRQDPAVPELQDNRPVNEYYLLREWRSSGN